MVAPAFASVLAAATTAVPFPAAAADQAPDIFASIANARAEWAAMGLPDLTNEITIIGTLTVVVPYFRER